MKKYRANEIIHRMTSENEDLYNERKLIEEMSELTKELVHITTKPSKFDTSKVQKELGDVKLRLEIVCRRYGIKQVNNRVEEKLKLAEKRLMDGKYRNV